MKLEPPNLNVPLYRRDWGRLWIPIIAGATAWLWHRPTNVVDAAISVIVGGAVLWFASASPLTWKLGLHRIPLVRGIWIVACVVGVVWFMHTVIPYLHALV
jgi:hypothetical protein